MEALLIIGAVCLIIVAIVGVHYRVMCACQYFDEVDPPPDLRFHGRNEDWNIEPRGW